jgi:hypothetical protein
MGSFRNGAFCGGALTVSGSARWQDTVFVGEVRIARAPLIDHLFYQYTGGRDAIQGSNPTFLQKGLICIGLALSRRFWEA